jgi:tRNA1Val (adenine37-N6)-methyltransferase
VSKPFHFIRFSVVQSDAAFKVGTDSVILGAWAACDSARRILDIGTGTGLLALMCAQRNPSAEITALEKDLPSLNEARNNFLHSPWAERLFPAEGNFETGLTAENFDYIISNPPYFRSALPSPEVRKNAARHIQPDGFHVLARRIFEWLTPEGKFGCILPEKEYELFARELEEKGLFLIRSRRVLPKPGAENKSRILSEWGKQPASAQKETDLFIRDEAGYYSAEYRKLTEEFYPDKAF